MVVAIWLAVLNLSLEARFEYDPATSNLGPTAIAGWPYHYWKLGLQSLATDTVDRSLYRPPANWFLGGDAATWGAVDRHALSLDLLVASAIMLLVVGGFEVWRRRRRQLWQWRLADLLIAVLFFAMLFGWIAQRRDEARDIAAFNRDLPALLVTAESARPTVVWNFCRQLGWPAPRHVVAIEPTIHRGSSDEPPRVGDDDLARLLPFDRLRCAYLPYHDSPAGPFPIVRITDGGLAQLGKLTGLEYLSLPDHPGITDAGLPQLARLARLEFLNLRGTSVTPAGIAALQHQLPHATIVGP
ncbi:MAG: hypothetical protein AB7U73_13490 [Pirellulales bacterium]